MDLLQPQNDLVVPRFGRTLDDHGGGYGHLTQHDGGGSVEATDQLGYRPPELLLVSKSTPELGLVEGSTEVDVVDPERRRRWRRRSRRGDWTRWTS